MVIIRRKRDAREQKSACSFDLSCSPRAPRTHIHTHTHAHAHARTHAHTYTHAHIHTRTHILYTLYMYTHARTTHALSHYTRYTHVCINIYYVLYTAYHAYAHWVIMPDGHRTRTMRKYILSCTMNIMPAAINSHSYSLLCICSIMKELLHNMIIYAHTCMH